MNAPNPSEKLVADLCNKSFLSLWSYPMPQGVDGGKELCDVLVVCDPDIIIISIKEIGYKETGDVNTDWQRWRKKAIENSSKQIYGAERYIGNSRAVNVITNDGQAALLYPDISRRKIYRAAVALGSQGKVPLTFGDFGKGFVHVFDEQSLHIIMNELDTVTDFVKYLSDKEELYTKGKLTLFASGGEEDMLAYYLHNGREFPDRFDVFVFDSDYWSALIGKPEWLARKEADRASYFWDKIIETLIYDLKNNGLISGYPYSSTGLVDVEQIVRVMAREDRFSRRMLAEELDRFLRSKKSRARIVPSLSGVQYVFLASQPGEDRQDRVIELATRCHIARGLKSDSQIVIGIATEIPSHNTGYSLDVILVDKPIWTDEDQRQMVYLQQETGYFAKAVHYQRSGREYPE